jgi:hypothetical protein
MELILLVSKPYLEMVGHFRALDHPQNHIEVGRSHLFGVNLSLSRLRLENKRNSLFLEVLFVEGTKLV